MFKEELGNDKFLEMINKLVNKFPYEVIFGYDDSTEYERLKEIKSLIEEIDEYGHCCTNCDDSVLIEKHKLIVIHAFNTLDENFSDSCDILIKEFEFLSNLMTECYGN